MPRLHTRFSRVSVARWVSLVVGLVSLIYNFSHFLEIAVITCFDPVENRTRPDVAPTPLRTDPLYVRLYYLYGYSVVMSVGPLLLLSVLAALVAAEIQRQKRRRQFWHHLVAISLPFETEIPACDDPTTLIAVVLLFLGCNSLALAVNFLEMSVDLGPTLNYLVDLSNFLVIFNSAANFFLYLTCGPAFRTELRRSMAALLPHSSEVRLDTGASRVNSMPVQSFAPLADLDSICSDG